MARTKWAKAYRFGGGAVVGVGRERIHPVLLSGGSGSRLWPLSRENRPKQLLRLGGDLTLFQQAALRVADSGMFEPPTVVCNVDHRATVEEQLSVLGVDARAVIMEPVRRNTAAAAAIAALLIAADDPDALLLLVPTDHFIADAAALGEAVRIATTAARQDYIGLFGIRPQSPLAAYGYIRVGEPLACAERVHSVRSFVEKPDAATASTYVDSGEYLWNSGIFLVSAGTILAELSRHRPDILECCRAAVARCFRDGPSIVLDTESLCDCPSISFDHAVMERTVRAAVIPVEFGWADIGSWLTLSESAERDLTGNTIIGEVLTDSTQDSYIRSEGPTVATIGIEGLIIIATADAVLVARKDRDQDVRNIVARLRDRDPRLV